MTIIQSDWNSIRICNRKETVKFSNLCVRGQKLSYKSNTWKSEIIILYKKYLNKKIKTQYTQTLDAMTVAPKWDINQQGRS